MPDNGMKGPLFEALVEISWDNSKPKQYLFYQLHYKILMVVAIVHLMHLAKEKLSHNRVVLEDNFNCIIIFVMSFCGLFFRFVPVLRNCALKCTDSLKGISDKYSNF